MHTWVLNPLLEWALLKDAPGILVKQTTSKYA